MWRARIPPSGKKKTSERSEAKSVSPENASRKNQSQRNERAKRFACEIYNKSNPFRSAARLTSTNIRPEHCAE